MARWYHGWISIESEVPFLVGHPGVPPQNPVDRTIVDVSVLGVELARLRSAIKESPAEAGLSDGGDPNEIRTRVTGLRGRPNQRRASP